MQLERRFNLIDQKFGEQITAQDGYIWALLRTKLGVRCERV